MKSFFITGTDSEIGKTYITSLLIKYAVQNKRHSCGFKPIAAGAEKAFEQWINIDAITLLESGNVNLPYEVVNPYLYQAPIAPHIAAENEARPIKLEGLNQAYAKFADYKPDILFCEGAGGWALPINSCDYLYDWVKHQNLPVILVVGIRAGCINHALLTLRHIQTEGIECAGWIADFIDPDMQEQQATLDALKQRLNVPLLAEAPYSDDKPKLKIRPELKALLDF